jgi:hypothetical protein
MNGPICFIVGSWNVRGLGDSDKCDSVKADLAFARPSLVGLQESKLGPISVSKAASFLPLFSTPTSLSTLLALRGGLVSAWTTPYVP